VVLVGEGGAEERHDPVAHHLVHRALVVVDRVHHALEHRIEELPRFLGVSVGQKLHRSLEVGEEHGDQLALARAGPGLAPLEPALRGEDLLGQVPGCVDLGDAASGLTAESGSWGAAEGSSAGPAELLALPDRLAAGGTRQSESGAALLAEPRALVVGRLASGTLHGDSQQAARRGAPPSVASAPWIMRSIPAQ